ncbi:Tyrosine recombinase XerD [compost metagenome]
MDTEPSIPKGFSELLSRDEMELVVKFLIWLLRGPAPVAPQTARTYLNQLLSYLRILGVKASRPLVGLVSRANLNKALMETPLTQGSKRRNMVFAIKAFTRFLAEMEVITETEAKRIADLVFKDKHKPDRPFLKPHQIHAVIEALTVKGTYDDIERLTNLTIVAFLAYTGLRNSEACDLKKEDVDFDAGLIRVKKGKGGKSRVVGISHRLIPLLKVYDKHRPATKSPNFFVGPQGSPLDRDLMVKRFARISALTGVKVTPHALRRSFCTMLAHKSIPLDKLQAMMGHASVSTTMIYVRTDADEVAQEMRDWL